MSRKFWMRILSLRSDGIVIANQYCSKCKFVFCRCIIWNTRLGRFVVRIQYWIICSEGYIIFYVFIFFLFCSYCWLYGTLLQYYLSYLCYVTPCPAPSPASALTKPLTKPMMTQFNDAEKQHQGKMCQCHNGWLMLYWCHSEFMSPQTEVVTQKML